MEVSGQNAYSAIHLPSLYPRVPWQVIFVDMASGA
jgi:hypothetical protein